MSAGLGLETAGAPHSADVWNYDVRLRGTGEVIRQNLFGRAATFSLVGQLSIRERRVEATWQQPYFFGIPINTFLNAWWEQEQLRELLMLRIFSSPLWLKAKFNVSERLLWMSTESMWRRTKLWKEDFNQLL